MKKKIIAVILLLFLVGTTKQVIAAEINTQEILEEQKQNFRNIRLYKRNKTIWRRIFRRYRYFRNVK